MREELLRRRRARASEAGAAGKKEDAKVRAQQQRDVTASLRRSMQGVSAELGRAAETARVLDEDKASLAKTNELLGILQHQLAP